MSQHQQQPPPPSLGGAPPAAFNTAVNTAMASSTGAAAVTTTSTSTSTTTTKASKKKAAAPKKATGPAATKAKAPKKPAAPRTKKTSSTGAAGGGTAGTTGGKKTSGSNSNNNNNNASGLTSAAAMAAANAEMIQADATIARLDLAKQRSMAIQRKSDPLWYRIEDVLLVPALPSQSSTYSNNHHNSHIATVITNTVLPEQIAVVDRALSHAGGLQRSDVTPQAMVCLMEQARRIAYELMTDAQDYAYAAGRSEITVPDLILAQELRSDLSSSSNVTTQLPKLNLTAQQMNRVPLPPIPIQCYNGVVLPPKAHQLTARTFDVVTASMVAQKMIQPVPKSPASMKKSPNHNNDAKGSSTTTTTATGGYGASRGQRQIPISLKSTNTSTNIATAATTTTSSSSGTSTSTTANPVTTTTTPPLTNVGPATSSTIAPDNITPPSNSNGPNVEQQPLPPTATPQMGVVDITGTQPPDSSTTIRMPNQSALNTATPMEDVTITAPPEVGQTLVSLPPPPPQNDTTSSTSMDIATTTTTSTSNPSITLQPP